MQVENIIKALEHQRNAALTQNVELLANNMALQQEILELKKKLADIEEKS